MDSQEFFAIVLDGGRVVQVGTILSERQKCLVEDGDVTVFESL